MQFVPYLSFNGDCREAFEHYAKVLGGTLRTVMTHGETPAKDHVPPEWADKIINVHMVVDGQSFMGADSPPGYYREPAGTTVNIVLPSSDVERGRALFEALLDGGKVVMPFGETFWAKGFGMGVDRFGTPWMVNCFDPA